MSQYLVLSYINVQNANSIAGLTWGFPAITSFLGFTHALSRQLTCDYDDINLSGCAVISNRIHNKVYKPKLNADFEFLQSKNPPVLAKHKSGKSVPIIEESKMNLTVSLVIEIEQPLSLNAMQIKQFEQDTESLALEMRLAGGTILNIKKVKLLTGSTESELSTMLRSIQRLVMPGFVLLDRSHYLQAHYHDLKEQDDEAQLLDAWLDYSALCYRATPQEYRQQISLPDANEDKPNESIPAEWLYQPKPQSGWLVPLMVGYKAISKLYEAGEVLNTRDNTTPVRFVEAIHSIGEWKGAHSISSIPDVIWRYDHSGEWYLCHQINQNLNHKAFTGQDYQSTSTEELKLLNLEDALNLF